MFLSVIQLLHSIVYHAPKHKIILQFKLLIIMMRACDIIYCGHSNCFNYMPPLLSMELMCVMGMMIAVTFAAISVRDSSSDSELSV